ncbi:thiol-disulfide oxidoreductase LTO1 [Selaginella moellendorffii]|uniref:thiol-disulfide oxidoreductase LTO1 n=1 Tax=Selaginella moellendorffii TaxID=88036 RepID=UPI000D1CA00F|nr:thiol-disulfide oxidoreductase LTO1 [Selaginella moellendorffii]|eukprot:XP_024536881.1 thiol-disulfide oxidoreductase LTO1 [Selaginella moellendorffii]
MAHCSSCSMELRGRISSTSILCKNPSAPWCRGQARPKYFRIQASNLATERKSGSPSVSIQPEPRKIPYGLITSLSGLGAIETAYLSWIKIFGGSAICPASGPGHGCNDVLNSAYSTLFGTPLSLIGFVAYSSISLLGFSMIQSLFPEDDVRWLLLGGTTALVSASSYFLYLLTFKLENASCAYCVASVLLSFGLFISTLKGFKWKDVPRMAGLQLVVGAAVIFTLSTGFAAAGPALAGSSEDIDLPPIEPEVTTSSDATKMALAKHLKSIGAKMYGAFWCSHCHEQKQELGKEAMKILEYVECFPDGYRKNVKTAKACEAAKIEGFPTWIIKGEKYSGELSLEELADAAGFSLEK